jgi:hypothetical protein
MMPGGTLSVRNLLAPRGAPVSGPPLRGTILTRAALGLWAIALTMLAGLTLTALAIAATPPASLTPLGTLGVGRDAGAAEPALAVAGIWRRIARSMARRKGTSSGAQNEMATPAAPARAVRPMRWT